MTKAFNDEQWMLWKHVIKLWHLARLQDVETLGPLLHPDYCGWVIGSDAAHDRAAALCAVGPGSPRLSDYELTPVSVAVFDGRVGVVHYRYSAEVEATPAQSQTVQGRWSEVYERREDGQWILLSVTGGPDGQRE